MKHFLLFFLIFNSICTNAQAKSESDKAYIDSIEKYIYSYEQDSLEVHIADLQESGVISKKKFKLFRKVIGGFYDYTVWFKDSNNLLFVYKYGENYIKKKKYPDYDSHYYFKKSKLVKYYKLTEYKEYIYETIVYFKDDKIVSLENTNPDFSIDEMHSQVEKIKMDFEN